MTHYITPEKLTFEQIEKILTKKYKLALSDESKKLINDCKAYLDHKIATSDKPLYGITTGFGSLCKISISQEDLSQLQANLVMSHACSLGEPVHKDIIRLMLLLAEIINENTVSSKSCLNILSPPENATARLSSGKAESFSVMSS